MSATEQELHTLLDEAYAQPDGRARFEALDGVFRHADAVGATRFAFDARLAAMSPFVHSGDPTRALLAFSWCLAAADRQPELLHGGNEHDLLWKFKWIVGDLPEFPEIPRARIMSVLDDMEGRYRRNGKSMHAVYQSRTWVASALGDLAESEEWYQRFLTQRRDDLSDCGACVPSGMVGHLVDMGRYEEAVAVGAQHKNRSCLHQPHSMLAKLLPAYLETGRYEEAVEAYRRGYPPMRNNPKYLGSIGLHVLFCARTGNEATGLTLVERHLPWLDRPETPMADMWFSAPAAALLRRVADLGGGGQLIRRQSEDGTRRWTSTVAELGDELAARATALAARFDARNGNGAQGGWVAGVLAARPCVEHLPLTVLAGRALGPRGGALAALVERVAELTASGDEVGAARMRLDVAHALRNADRWEDAAEAAEEAARALERAGLAAELVRCRYLLWELYRRSWETRTEALAALEALEAVEPAQLPADLPPLEQLLEEAADILPWRQAVPRLLAAAERHRAAGRPADELRALRKALDEAGPIGGALRRAALGRAEELLAESVALPEAERARIGLLAARLAVHDGRPADALARTEEAVAQLEAADLPEEWTEALTLRAYLLLAVGRAAEAESQARAVHASEEDWTAGLVVVRALRAQGLAEAAAEFMGANDIDEDELGWDRFADEYDYDDEDD